jgi:phosphomannomutase
LVASDHRPWTLEPLAAASDGLRHAGCRVVELEACTAGLLAWAVAHRGAAGGLLIGNPGTHGRALGISFFGPQAQPWSAGGPLDQVRALTERPPARGSRAAPGRQRALATPDYLAQGAQWFYALRPLRVVFDSLSQPLQALAATALHPTGCQLLSASAVADIPVRCPAPPGAAGPAPRRRLAAVQAAVLAQRADLGLWADGQGQACVCVDELGQTVSPARLLAALAVHQLQPDAPPALVLGQDVDPDLAGLLAARGLTTVHSGASCSALWDAMCQSGAPLGGNASGYLLLGRLRPTADALWVLGHLLTLLSRSDRPLSQVLDDAAPSGYNGDLRAAAP